MSNKFLLKKSSVAGRVPTPSDLEYGELALNYTDGRLYYKAANGSITYIQSGGGGGTTDSFATINANSSLILATSPTDTLSIVPGNNITISACTTTKTVTINAQDADVDQYARQTANAAFDKANTPWGYLANTSYTAVLNSSGQFVLPNITTGGYTGGTMVSTQSFIMNAAGNLWAFDTAGQLISPYSVKITTGGIAWPDGSLQNTAAASLAYSQASFNKANSANSLAQSAFNQANDVNGMAVGAYTTANTASSNTIVIQGVDIWQNSQITLVNQFAQSAYNKANNALANTTGTFNGTLTTTGNVIINSGISSTSNTTGSLLVSGGAGITGNVYADKIFVNGLYWAANGNVISTGSSTSGGTTNQFNFYKYVATAGQTTFSGNDSEGNSLTYTPTGIFVTYNGATLNPKDEFTATNGTSIVLAAAATAGDEINIFTFPAFAVANTYTQAQANTLFLDRTTANTTFNTKLNITGGQLTGNLTFATGANLIVPSGNTAQRPANTAGLIRFNTDFNTLESANGTAWANVGSGSAISSGGGAGANGSTNGQGGIGVLSTINGKYYGAGGNLGDIQVSATPISNFYNIKFIFFDGEFAGSFDSDIKKTNMLSLKLGNHIITDFHEYAIQTKGTLAEETDMEFMDLHPGYFCHQNFANDLYSYINENYEKF